MSTAVGTRDPEATGYTARRRISALGQHISTLTERRRFTLALITALAALCAVVTSINLVGYPLRFKDEGVYVAEAWAVPNLHALANYTYWYDHPPLGWLQMSIWFELTRGLQRWSGDTTVAGREFMVVLRVATCVLIFLLARRLGMRRAWSAAAVLLFVFSPLAMYYGRLVLLDNIALPWLLAAFLLALSPRRKWSAAVGSAVCFAVTVETKETLAVVAPALLYALWQNYRPAANRRYAWVSFAVVLTMTAALYPLYAILKNELIPGPGHVSLIQAIEWQLHARKGSGSVFDPHSDARNLVDSWLNLDTLLPIGGSLAAVALLTVTRYRALMLAVLLQLATLLRTGYLPSMYIDTLLPLMALALAGLGDTLWPRDVFTPDTLGAILESPPRRTDLATRRSTTALLGTVLVVASVLSVLPGLTDHWTNTLRYQWTADADRPERQVVTWLATHVPHNAVLVSEGELWLDLHNAGFSGNGNVWVYKVDSDPAVTKWLGSWTRIDYLALSQTTLISESESTMPWVFKALHNADVMTTFGQNNDKVTILEVRK
ncbi:ArnT family glycosyltransferase [Nocardia sp. NPDC101769]|uniref:ArnT family glycosyltransferase n=1 Tax=Nocardia sp. NPDC101769 TaxID=3364333 RepID=UPI0037F8CEED